MGNWDVSKPNKEGERELLDRAVKALETELATKTCNKQITSKLENAELARDSEETCNNKQVISKLVASDDAISIRVVIEWLKAKDIIKLSSQEETARKELEALSSVTQKQEPCEDAISRQEVLDMMQMRMSGKELYKAVYELPPVTPKQRTGWIPFTYRPATDEEKKGYAERTGYDEEDIDTILNCQLPEDGETVLITDRLGNVEVDTFINDCDGCYFECNCDMEDVRAWMPLPKPYDPQESEEISREEIAALLARESEEQA